MTHMSLPCGRAKTRQCLAEERSEDEEGGKKGCHINLVWTDVAEAWTWGLVVTVEKREKGQQIKT